jgi:hypothetical protein
MAENEYEISFMTVNAIYQLFLCAVHYRSLIEVFQNNLVLLISVMIPSYPIHLLSNGNLPHVWL